MQSSKLNGCNGTPQNTHAKDFFYITTNCSCNVSPQSVSCTYFQFICDALGLTSAQFLHSTCQTMALLRYEYIMVNITFHDRVLWGEWHLIVPMLKSNVHKYIYLFNTSTLSVMKTNRLDIYLCRKNYSGLVVPVSRIIMQYESRCMVLYSISFRTCITRTGITRTVCHLILELFCLSR